MTDLQEKVLEAIEKNKTVMEITTELNISSHQLIQVLNTLKSKGLETKQVYEEQGNIILKQQNTLKHSPIKINSTEKSSKYLVISDLHLGKKESGLGLMDKVYQYAVDNGIHIILNLGDFFDGSYENKIEYIKNVNNLLNQYPYEPNILNFVLLGNHDNESMTKDGINLSTIITNNRMDIVPVGIGQASLNIHSDNLILFHRIKKEAIRMSPQDKLILMGHHHKYTCSILEDTLQVNVPSLAKIPITPHFLETGMIELNLEFNGTGRFEQVLIKHLLLEKKPITCSEFTYTYKKR